MSLDKLVEKWREEAEKLGETCMSDGSSGVYEICADELEAALAGDGEAVAWARLYDDEIVDISSNKGRCDVPLYLHPAGAVQVTDEAVEAFASVWWKDDWPFKPDNEANRELMSEFRAQIKRAITSALNPGGSRE